MFERARIFTVALWLALAGVCMGQPFGLYLTPSDLLAGSGISLSVSGKKVTITATGAAGAATNAISGVQSNSVLIGTNITVINFVGGTNFSVASNASIATITIPTNAPSSGGGGTNYAFNGNQFTVTNGTNVSIKSSALTTNQTLVAPYMSYFDGSGYATVVEPMNNGVWAYNDVNNYWKFDSTNWTMFLPFMVGSITNSVSADFTNSILRWEDTGNKALTLQHDSGEIGWKYDGSWFLKYNGAATPKFIDSSWNIRIPDAIATNDAVTLAQLQSATNGIVGGTMITNYPVLSLTNSATRADWSVATNNPELRLYTTYTDASNNEYLRMMHTPTGAVFGTERNAGTTNSMPIYFKTDGTNRWIVDETGVFKPNFDWNVSGGGVIGSATRRPMITAWTVNASGGFTGGSGNFSSVDFGSNLERIGRVGVGVLYLRASGLTAGTNFGGLCFGTSDAEHVMINTTNQTFKVTTANDLIATNPIVTFDPINRTNWLGGTTTATNFDSTFPRIGNLRITDATETFSVTNTTYRRLTNWTENVANGCTVAMTNGYITNDIAGYYQVQIGMSFSGPAAARTYRAVIQTNDVATTIAFQHEISSAMTGDANAFGQLYLPAGTALSFAIKQDTSQDNITIKEARFTVQKCQ